MKKNIHLKLNKVAIKCNCGNVFDLLLVFEANYLNVEVCSECHPFYTGQQKIIDISGRVDSFNRKFNKLNQLKF